MDGGPVDRVMGSSAGAAERARRETALDLANRLAEAEGEEREDALDFAAYQMGRLVGHGFDLSDASTMLFGGARACGLVDDVGVDAVQATVARAIEDGQLAAIEEIREAEVRRRGGGGEQQAEPAPPPPIELHDGDDDEPIAPRPWLLGTTFCKEFVSAIVAAGATGKTAVRLTQLMALATGRPLTGEFVHRRVRVLWVSLEDNEDEMRRRVRACRLHHKIDAADIRGWFFRITLARNGAKVVVRGEDGTMMAGPLADTLKAIVVERGIELVSFDPFVKAHTADENDNKAVDEVMQVLVRLADELSIAIDTTHHVRKGTAEAGDSDLGRGASAMRDALRLGKTLTVMSKEEATGFDIKDTDRRRYIRYDDSKPNLAPAEEAIWFHLVGVHLGNGTKDYPNGDNVQTVERWDPPDTWAGLTSHLSNLILDDIEAGLPDGERYSNHASTRAPRQAWRVVQKHIEKTDRQARQIVKKWIDSGVLKVEPYPSKLTRSEAQGLRVNNAMRPG